MVECEFAYNIGSITGLTVLIDTWWNVNESEVPEWYKKYGF